MRFGQKLLSTLLIFAMMLTVNVGKANTAAPTWRRAQSGAADYNARGRI